MRRANAVRALLVAVACTCLGAADCGAGVRRDRALEPSTPRPSAAPPSTPPTPTRADELGECSPGCCSQSTRELQEETARRTGDPSIARECCFCGNGRP